MISCWPRKQQHANGGIKNTETELQLLGLRELGFESSNLSELFTNSNLADQVTKTLVEKSTYLNKIDSMVAVTFFKF